ncbi:MAG: hypothetical protein FJY56_04485 [Betaproteobacteria bacterium]|nr:hypothetical protein [Betaproteobacteria bacterium]
MQKRPTMIALAVAGVLVGATAGIAAISEVTSVPQPPAALPAVPAETQAAPPTNTETQTSTETQTQATVTETPAPARAPEVVAAPRAAPAPVRVAMNDDERMVRIPFTNRYVLVTNPVFPSAKHARLLRRSRCRRPR